MKQTTFASLAFERKKKSTRRERFLAEMEKVVPWAVWLAVIKPHCATTGPRRCAKKTGTGRVRICVLQNKSTL
jgi:hypothetical protein